MVLNFSFCFVSLFFISFVCNGQSLQGDDYKLVWADEFNKDGPPDTTVWNFEHGFVRNREDQWYQPQNAYCKDGKLIIKAKRVHLPNPWFISDSKDWKTKRKWINYTSASLNTSGHKSWQYGRFVVRAKIDTDSGLWPAFWTLGIKGRWPSNGEIDIIEYYRGDLLANVACGTSKPFVAKWFSVKKPVNSFAKNWSRHFHIWRMDWNKKDIKLYVDNFLMNQVPLDSLINPDGTNPFRQPHYILLNLAIGGNSGGNPENTKFPKKYEIDYVRIYQK